MELKVLLKHIVTRKWIIISITLFGLVLSALIAINLPPSNSASVTVYVKKSLETLESGDYTFDGYYAQQAVEGYTDTVIGLLESPDTMAATLRRYDISIEDSIGAYNSSLEVEKVAPQIVLVTVTRKDRQDAVDIVSELVSIASEKVVELNRIDSAQYSLIRVEDVPLVKVNTLPMVMVIIAGGLVALFVGMFGVVFGLYLREDD